MSLIKRSDIQFSWQFHDVRLRRYLLCSFPCPLPDVILTQKLSTFDIFYGIRCSLAKTWDSVVFALRHASFAAYFLSYLISQETFRRICTRKIITYFICTYLVTSNTHELWLITLHHQNNYPKFWIQFENRNVYQKYKEKWWMISIEFCILEVP